MRGRSLNETERLRIADRVREKASIREIARELGRAPSTISREIRRNRHPGNGQYRPHAAQAHAVAAELNSRPRKTLDRDTPAERLAKLLATCA